MINKSTSDNRKQRAAFLTLLISAGILFYFLVDFLIPFLGAVIFHQVLKKFMHIFTNKLKINIKLSAFILIITSLVLIILPLIYLIGLLYDKFQIILADQNSLLNNLHLINDLCKKYLNTDLISKENLDSFKIKITNYIPTLINKFFIILGQTVLMYFILYYMLIHYVTVERFIKSFLPFSTETVDAFLEELESITKSNVIGAPILAIIQSMVAVIAFILLGAPEPVFWGIMCGIFSFIPFVGSAIIWVPVSLIMYINNMHWQALVLGIYGIIVISNIDNVVRMYIQKYFSNVHPVITVLGVIFGLNVFGLPGLIFGPLLISYFITGINIYRKSYPPTNINSLQ